MYLDKRSVPHRWASTMSVGLSVTQLQQISAILKADTYFNEVRSRLFARVAFERMPNRFYGFGPYTPDSNETWYRPDYLRVETMYFHRLLKTEDGQGLTLGGRLEYWNTKMQGDIPVPPADSGEPVGWRGGVAFGMGLAATYDTRDNAYYPTRNIYVEARSMSYLKLVGGTFEYNRSYLDMRGYESFKLGENTAVIGGQMVWDYTIGGAPFYDMPTYGGADKMRGILSGRYVDRSSLTAQVELRSKLFWIVGAAVFAGVGDVAPSIDKHSFAHMKTVAGFGIRAYLDQEGGLIGRIDLGFSEWGTGVYVTFAEAF
jgi:outer membrane protein assembly factor BamA